MDHLSKTQMQSLDRCEFSFLEHYGHGKSSPPSWKMHAGSAIDSAVGADYKQKIKSHVNLPAKDVTEMTVADFRLRNRNEETDWEGKGVTEDDAIPHLVQTVEVFHAEVMAQVQPVAVQEPISVAFEGQDWTFDGFIDVRAEAGIMTDAAGGFCIIDNKATGKSGGWKDDDVATAIDPLAYDLGLRAKGIQVDGFEFHVARWGSGSKWLKQKANQILPVALTDEARSGFIKLVAAKKRRKDEILRTDVGMPRYGWWCKGCGFRSSCKKEWGREPPGSDD